MKYKKKILCRLSAGFLATVLLFAGCNKGEESSMPETSVTTVVTTATSAETTAAVSWQDSFDEEAFLESYIYPSSELCRTPFSSPEELSKSAVLNYCYNRMVINAETLDPAPANEYQESMCYVPAELLAEYAEQTFGLKNFTYTEYYNYLPEKNVYTIAVRNKADIPQIWGFEPAKSVEKEVDRLLVTIPRSADGFALADYKFTFVPTGKNFQLKSLTCTDASGGKRKFLSNKAILLDSVFDMPVDNIDYLRVYSTVGNRALVTIENFWQTRNIRLGYINLDNGKSEKWIEFPYDTSFYSYPDKIVVLYNTEVAYYDTGLNLIRTLKIPEEIHQNSPQAHYYISASPDGKFLAYNDSDGICLYDIEKKQKRLLFEHINASPEDVAAVRSFGVEGFSANSSKLICQLYGYEWVDSYRIYDLKTDTYLDLDALCGMEIPTFTDLYNGKVTYFKNPNPVTEENPNPTFTGYILHQFDFTNGTALERNLPLEIHLFDARYLNGSIYSATQEELTEFPLVHASAHQYDIIPNNSTAFSEQITDSSASLSPLAKSSSGKLLVNYYFALQEGYAIINSTGTPSVPEK